MSPLEVRSSQHRITRRGISGKVIVGSMFFMGICATTFLYTFWTLHLMPFMPLQEAIVKEFPGSAPRVDGGRKKLHKGTPNVLRIVLKSEVDPSGNAVYITWDGVAHVGGSPARPIQGSPSAFFSFTCSSVTHAMTASFLATCFSRASTFASSSFDGAAGACGCSAVAAFSKSCFC